jgi:putative glutamine amidotransferase
MNPLIAIVAHLEDNRFGLPANSISLTYTSSIERAGGLPLILPFTKDREILPETVARIDGVLFGGGIDVDPVFYGEQPAAALGAVNRDLDLFQMAVLNAAMSLGKPVLGICRGTQLVNVALGGSLVQDIPTQLGPSALVHMQETFHFGVDHPALIEPGSRLCELFGPRVMVNSRHHQCIKVPGKDLIVTARAPDGVVEGLQHKTLPLDLVQWHPEVLLQESNEMLCLFKMFVDQCSEEIQRRRAV